MKRTLWNALAMTSSSNGIPKQPCAVQELKLPCGDGMTLAGQCWTSNTTIEENNTILCLHGWLDNCRSFHHLAPHLSTALKSKVVALDLPGHGCSSHRATPPVVQSEMIYYVSEAVQQIIDESSDDSKLTLIGHSLGAGIASLYAAAFPEQVDNLVLLEGAGFLARDAKDTALHVRNHVVKRRTPKKKKNPRIYPSLDLAIKTRVQSARQLPGKQSISYEAAEELVRRGTTTSSSDDNDGVQFRHDVRFTWPSIQYMTWEQNCGIFDAIQSQCCIVMAEDGWPFDPDHLQELQQRLHPTMLKTLPGSHYFHADPSTAGAVADVVLDFLKSRK